MPASAREGAERLVAPVLAIAAQGRDPDDQTLSGTAHRLAEGLGALTETVTHAVARLASPPTTPPASSPPSGAPESRPPRASPLPGRSGSARRGCAPARPARRRAGTGGIGRRWRLGCGHQGGRLG